MDITIRNLDEQSYRSLRARAIIEGRTIADVLNEATRAYLARVPATRPRSTLRALTPEPFPPGSERLSDEIDAILYHDRR